MEQNAWKIVYDELIKVPLFRGHYDARNGGDQYIHGISTVMENIAYRVSEECADNFVWFVIPKEYDLCSDCMKSFEKWLKSEVE